MATPNTLAPLPVSNAKAPQVQWIRPELSNMFPKYDLISDCLDQSIKDKGDKYLPRPDASNKSAENVARYDAYSTRAVFYDVTSRTLGGLTGQIFANDPEIVIPAALKSVELDANGNGLTLIQCSKEAVRLAIAYGRLGLYTDYPVTDGPTSKAQQDSGEIKPTINVYGPKNIINWRTRRKGAKHIYDLVVFVEHENIDIDGFQTLSRAYYKVLKLVTPAAPNDTVPIVGTPIYVIEIWKANDVGVFPSTPTQTLIPLDANSQPLSEIPFTFVGAENNDPTIDASPLLPLADLNIGHYRNSADYEEACFIVGQPTYVVSGLTDKWYSEVLNKKLEVGSRGGIPLPVGADAKILQVQENTMAREAMEHKEKQMVAIGARLVEAKSVQQTATEVDINNSSETSALADIAKNVSAAFTYALKQAAIFVGAESEKIEYTLNTEFAINRLSSAERAELIGEWQKGAVTWGEMRRGLRDSGVAWEDDAAAKTQIANDAKATAQAAADAAGALTAATVAANPDAGKKPAFAAAA